VKIAQSAVHSGSGLFNIEETVKSKGESALMLTGTTSQTSCSNFSIELPQK